MRNFGDYHPIILFVYFVSVLVVTMLGLNPVLLGISFVSSAAFYGVLAGGKKMLKSLALSLIVIALFALTNPLFSHGGSVLFYLFDLPITLEAIVYGGAVGVMLTSVIQWFFCYNAVMSSDKFLYLFGRILPKISLLLSMSLSFAGRLRRQVKETEDAQRALGLFSSEKRGSRIRNKFRVFSVLVTWSLENSIDTADSMRARGYGVLKRTSFSVFRWSASDSLAAVILGLLIALSLTAAVLGGGGFGYYPVLTAPDFSMISIAVYAAVFVMMFLSVLIECKERAAWRQYLSKI